MSRLADLFARKKKGVLNIYCTAGFPAPDSTMPVLEALQEGGADLIEVGMPYSDPLADGPVIQDSGARALAGGMTIKKLFEDLRDMRKMVRVPVVLMGYMNPVLQFGFEKFCTAAATAGIDGLILPDLPPAEFESVYRPVLAKHGLDFIFLVTPETPDDRVRRLDALSSGFLYAVSSSSTTGSNRGMAGQEAYFKKLEGMGLKNPVLVGFGIRDRETFRQASEHAAGAIIGTAYIKAIADAGDTRRATLDFLKNIL